MYSESSGNQLNVEPASQAAPGPDLARLGPNDPNLSLLLTERQQNLRNWRGASAALEGKRGGTCGGGTLSPRALNS